MCFFVVVAQKTNEVGQKKKLLSDLRTECSRANKAIIPS